MRGLTFGMLVGFAIMGCKQEAPPVSITDRSQPCGPQTCALHEICVQRPVTQWVGDTPSRDGTCGSGYTLHHCDDGETLCCAEGSTARGRMRVLEVVSDADAIARILHGARAPPAPPPPGQVLLFA